MSKCKLLIAALLTSVTASAESIDLVDPAVLQRLESGGFSLGQMLGAGAPGTQTDVLYKTHALYKNFADTIGAEVAHDPATDQLPDPLPAGLGDIPEMVRLTRGFEDKGKRSEKDLKGGYFIRHLANNSHYPYQVESDGDEPRHFDTRWLNSKFAMFKLVAVINRLDRVDFDPGSCGEIRFIYRLMYRSAASGSSLPFFVTAVRSYPKQNDCSAYASAWLKDKVAALKGLRFKQLEVNFQSLRFTSGYMHDFGGQAMYMQRIFQIQDGVLTPVELENTPDVLFIEKNPELFTRFVKYISTPENLKKLDEGILNINFDHKFLAKRSISWSTLGRARTANKPYTRLFANRQGLLKSIDISGLRYIKSHAALVERLNNLTCMGCHQSGGTAGFHVLGASLNAFSHGFNRQEQIFSPHAFAESVRRAAYVTQLAAKHAPNRFRPHSTFGEGTWRGTDVKFTPLSLGQLCFADGDQVFAGAPSCADIKGRKTKCVKTASNSGFDPLLGECAVAENEASGFAGGVCWKGEIQENQNLPDDRGDIPAYNLFAFQDKFKMHGAASTKGKDYKCVLPQSGAPLGRMSRDCTVAEENFTNMKVAEHPAEVCANQGGNGFDLCAASGDSGACLQGRVVRAMLDTCYPGHFCREDYICQKFPDYDKISKEDYGRKKNGKRVNASTPDKIEGSKIAEAHARQMGFCVPTYFLFNMRLDGHPSPVTGQAPSAPKFDRSQPLRGYK